MPTYYTLIDICRRKPDMRYYHGDNVVAMVLGIEVCETPGRHYYLNTDEPQPFEVVTHRGAQHYALTCGHAVAPGEPYIWWRAPDAQWAFDLACAERLRPGPCMQAMGRECGCDGCAATD